MVSTFRWSDGSRASGALAPATRWATLAATTTERALATNNFQLLAEKNLDLNDGPLDTDRRHNLTLSGRIEVPRTERPDGQRVVPHHERQTVQHHRHQRGCGPQRDPVRPAAGRHLLPVTATNAITVKNEGGRNGAYGPNYLQLDARVGYRLRMGGARTLDLFAEVFNLTDRSNFTNPSGDRRTWQPSSYRTVWLPAGSRGNCRSARGSASEGKAILSD